MASKSCFQNLPVLFVCLFILDKLLTIFLNCRVLCFFQIYSELWGEGGVLPELLVLNVVAEAEKIDNESSQEPRCNKQFDSTHLNSFVVGSKHKDKINYSLMHILPRFSLVGSWVK